MPDRERVWLFGLWWFPYTVQTVRGGRSRPVTVGALLVLPLVAGAVVAGTVPLIR